MIDEPELETAVNVSRETLPKESTQQIHPARAVLRTVVAMGIGFIPVGSLLIKELGLESVPFFAAALGLGAAITRVLAFPETARFLNRYAPWLHEEGYRGRHRMEDKDNGNMYR